VREAPCTCRRGPTQPGDEQTYVDSCGSEDGLVQHPRAEEEAVHNAGLACAKAFEAFAGTLAHFGHVPRLAGWTREGERGVRSPSARRIGASGRGCQVDRAYM